LHIIFFLNCGVFIIGFPVKLKETKDGAEAIASNTSSSPSRTLLLKSIVNKHLHNTNSFKDSWFSSKFFDAFKVSRHGNEPMLSNFVNRF